MKQITDENQYIFQRLMYVPSTIISIEKMKNDNEVKEVYKQKLSKYRDDGTRKVNAL